MTSVQHHTSLTESTVQAQATNPTTYTPRTPRTKPSGVWNSPLARTQIDDRLLASALQSAGGDPARLWFGDDGAVWVLNHGRMTTCISAACPACVKKRGKL